ncbi:MAG: hypothetical protein ACMUIL_01975 [bacterium]
MKRLVIVFGVILAVSALIVYYWRGYFSGSPRRAAPHFSIPSRHCGMNEPELSPCHHFRSEKYGADVCCGLV